MTADPDLRARSLVETARTVAAASPDGRLPLPDLTTWDIFPFEGSIQVKVLDDVTFPEPPRHGAGGIDCHACGSDDVRVVWSHADWTLRTAGSRDPVLSVLLEPVVHKDLSDLSPRESAQLGELIVRVTKTMESLPGVGRVHVNRWGDGSEHLHVWFFARPAGVLQLRGSCLPDWLDVLPPMDEGLWEADLAALSSALHAAGPLLADSWE